MAAKSKADLEKEITSLNEKLTAEREETQKWIDLHSESKKDFEEFGAFNDELTTGHLAQIKELEGTVKTMKAEIAIMEGQMEEIASAPKPPVPMPTVEITFWDESTFTGTLEEVVAKVNAEPGHAVKALKKM